MNINDLISQKGEEFIHTTELSIPEDIDSLEGIQKFDSLERIHIKRETVETDDDKCPFSEEPKITDYHLLGSKNLQKRLIRLELDCTTNLTDVSFLQGYEKLEEFSLMDTDIKDLSPVAALADTLTLLNIRGDNKLESLSFLRHMKRLKELQFEGQGDEMDLSPLSSSHLQEGLESIHISTMNVDAVGYLKDYKSLKNIWIGNSYDGRTADITLAGLVSDSLRQTVTELTFLEEAEVVDLDMIRGYKCLERINVISCNHLKDVSALDDEDFRRSIKTICFKGEKVEDIGFISEYEQLEELDLTECTEISDYSFLSSKKLKTSLKTLILGKKYERSMDTNKFSELTILQDYENLAHLDLSNTQVRDISDLLSYEFVRNRSLKEISLPDSLDWTMQKDGKYIIQDIVKTLKERGINVKLPSTFEYREQPTSKPEEQIEKLLDRLSVGELEKSFFRIRLLEKFHMYKSKTLSTDEKGFTGRGVVKSENVAVKIDNTTRLMKEFSFYTNVASSELQEFCPRLIDTNAFEECEGIGFLGLENLDNRIVPGFMAANNLIENRRAHKFQDNGIQYNLFLMSLFHNKVRCFPEEFLSALELTPYVDLNGNPHHLTTDEPGINDSGEAYHRFKNTRIANEGFVGRINIYNEMLMQMREQSQLIVIHGDWKPDNLVNGYLVDFSCIGFSLEIDELAYYLSDAKHHLNFEGFVNHVGDYLHYRTPPERRDLGSLFTSHTLLQDAWLRQLVLRHSVMKKRDLMDDSKYQERQYYQHRIHEVLKQGDFI